MTPWGRRETSERPVWTASRGVEGLGGRIDAPRPGLEVARHMSGEFSFGREGRTRVQRSIAGRGQGLRRESAHGRALYPHRSEARRRAPLERGKRTLETPPVTLELVANTTLVETEICGRVAIRATRHGNLAPPVPRDCALGSVVRPGNIEKGLRAVKTVWNEDLRPASSGAVAQLVSLGRPDPVGEIAIDDQR
jgi:hypothetical protein